MLNLLKVLYGLILYWPLILLYISSNQRDFITSDLNVMIKHTRIREKGISAFVRLIRDPFFRNLFYHRVGKKTFLLAKLYPGERHFRIRSKIGYSFYAAHSYSTIINAKSIGNNCVIHQCTTIGNKYDGRNDLVPTIGDNVIIGAHSLIIGDIYIGNNVIIGAGSVVTKDIPDNTVVAGNPAQVIKSLKNED